MQILTDRDLMPIGQHKGKALVNVPAHHLIYLFDKGWMDGYPALKRYVVENLQLLKNEINRLKR